MRLTTVNFEIRVIRRRASYEENVYLLENLHLPLFFNETDVVFIFYTVLRSHIPLSILSA